MIESDYDEQLRKLKNLKWRPWIGKHYSQNPIENKILLIGESHYLDNKPNADEYYKLPDATRNIVKDMGVGGNNRGSYFFINTYKLLFNDRTFDSLGCHRLWDNVAFYNFIQVPMKDKNTRPTEQEMAKARSNFLDLLEVLEPSVCIFLGLKAEQNLNESIKNFGYELIKPVSWKEQCINGCYGRYGRIETSKGKMIKLIFVKHPSKYFSYGSWNTFLQKYISEQLNWLKQIS